MNRNGTGKTGLDFVRGRVFNEVKETVRVLRQRALAVLRLPAGVSEVREVNLFLVLLVVDGELSFDV